MLQQLDDGIWTATTRQRIPGGVTLPAAMFVIRLDDGLWIHSPIAIDDALAAQIDALGPVRHLVSPNLFHHLHLGPASQRWPDATVYAAPGLRAKRVDLRIDVELQEGQQPWGEAVEIVEIHGVPELDEFVFLHRPSATLVLCDLVFNIHEDPRLGTRLILRMVGVWQRLRQSKLWRGATKDRATAAASCERLLELEFSRIVMAHGVPAEGDDLRARLRDALEWMLAGKQHAA